MGDGVLMSEARRSRERAALVRSLAEFDLVRVAAERRGMTREQARRMLRELAAVLEDDAAHFEEIAAGALKRMGADDER